ncbi:hypothetical protein [Dokdonia sp.]|uniref:hypothetical protein n=1 Tax=Dokdonia sp. TaxID=2024995 RepID=UPI003264DC0C
MKYLLLLFLSFTSSLVFSQSETLDYSITAKTSFNGRHCRGTHGLCNFDDAARDIDSNSIITYNEENNLIVIQIERTKLSQDEQSLILREDPQNYTDNTPIYYLMEDDFIIPNGISQQLQIHRENVRILHGMYPLTITEDTITITFNLE